jgi:hypothetical protein
LSIGQIFITRKENTIEVTIGRAITPGFSPALITIMMTVLEKAMTVEQATTAMKAYLAEFI